MFYMATMMIGKIQINNVMLYGQNMKNLQELPIVELNHNGINVENGNIHGMSGRIQMIMLVILRLRFVGSMKDLVYQLKKSA